MLFVIQKDFLGGVLCRLAIFKLKKVPVSHSQYVVRKDTLAQFYQIFGFAQDDYILTYLLHGAESFLRS